MASQSRVCIDESFDLNSDEDILEEDSDYSDYSDVDESTVHVQFSKVYIDSLQEIFDKLDMEANAVLRTGKLSVTGEPGDSVLMQPLLFSLQAKEEEIPLILPQMMQTPFFSQFKDTARLSSMSIIGPDNTLAMGRFRLGVVNDQLIYHLLSSHCCKGPGSRQADAVIEATLKSKYALPSHLHQMMFYAKNPPPLVPCGIYTETKNAIPESGFSDSDSDPVSSEEEIPDLPEHRISNCSDGSKSRNTSTSSGIGLCKSPSLTNGRTSNNGIPIGMADAPPFLRQRSGSCRERKDSIYAVTPFSPPPHGLRPRTGSGTGSFSLGIVHTDPKKWHVDIPYPKDMLIGMYGDSSYPILHWNPSLQVSFKIGVIRSMVAEIENSQSITFTVKNTYSHNVAFAIRSHRQSMMFHSHIIYPKEGLHLLEPGKEWKKDMDIMASNGTSTEYIVIDLFICCLEGDSSWNVHRRYAVFKPANREEHKMVKKISHGLPILPGAFTNQQKDLGYALKQVILHGLQCVVKNKLDEAEIILTQALQLPIFQRISLKAFLYVCLAIVSNKRRKMTNSEQVGQIMKFVGCLDQLVQGCELSPNMAMPKMVGLVKQLRKELDPQKVIKSISNKKKGKKTIQPPIKEVDMAGGDIALDNITLIIPGKAITAPIKVSLTTLSKDEHQSSLDQSPWATMLDIISIFCISCTPPVDKFEVPVIASIDLPRPISPNVPLRLLHSSYMSHWEDITSHPTTEVSVNDTRLTVRTSYTDWLIVASLNLDLKQIMQLAVTSVFTEEPILLQVNVYAHMFNDTDHGQISAFITPIVEEHQKKINGPTGHKIISFPHSFKAYNSQKLQLEFIGHFKPDVDAGQSDLLYNFVVQSSHQQVIEKKVILTENKTRIDGKLMISSYVTSKNSWETIREINLSATNISSGSLTVPSSM